MRNRSHSFPRTQVASNFISDDFITSENFYERTFILRVLLLGLWAKISLYKYISCWLLTEGVCITSGMPRTFHLTCHLIPDCFDPRIFVNNRTDLQREGQRWSEQVEWLCQRKAAHL